MPRRRGVLKKSVLALTTFTTAGCLVGDDSSPVTPPAERDRPCWQTVEGDDLTDKRLFLVADEDEMMLPEEEVHFQYEKYEDPDYPTFDAYVDTRDYSQTALMKVRVYADEQSAKEAYREIKSNFSNPKNFSIGDEAAEEVSQEHAEMVFRKSNAVGHVISYVPEEAPEDPADRRFTPKSTTSMFARDLRDWWGGTSDFRKEPGFCRESVRRNT